MHGSDLSKTLYVSSLKILALLFPAGADKPSDATVEATAAAE
jgi:hypothetical protein